MRARMPLAISIETCALAGLLPPDDAPSDFAVARSAAEWRAMLSGPEYRVLREDATEPAHSSPLAGRSAAGIYACRGCDAPLYGSAAKFDAGTGRPTFARALPGAVLRRRVGGFLPGRRVLCRCARCDSHIGRLVEADSAGRGERHVLNGTALVFPRA
ncbi:peptide-methionine (R)-S-oxide reductase [Oceaniglobus roseus]|uniref:peptide-methionine (R)-S-oxide reductase n=1 Tax=Oceaniglobus roseus TaxID=1737570 RepID=UPI000C7E8604|nr:peptide-methionine (R)-S-oxide reductase [Kandeliimicrobium roseum]